MTAAEPVGNLVQGVRANPRITDHEDYPNGTNIFVDFFVPGLEPVAALVYLMGRLNEAPVQEPEEPLVDLTTLYGDDPVNRQVSVTFRASTDNFRIVPAATDGQGNDQTKEDK